MNVPIFLYIYCTYKLTIYCFTLLTFLSVITGIKHISWRENCNNQGLWIYFKLEAERGKLGIQLAGYAKRTLDIFKLNRNTLMKMVKRLRMDPVTQLEIFQKVRQEMPKKNCSFQKYLIKRSVYKFYQRNEMMTIKRLCKYPIEHENMDTWKYILLKLLHQMGFTYNKDCSNSREVICELAGVHIGLCVHWAGV